MLEDNVACNHVSIVIFHPFYRPINQVCRPATLGASHDRPASPAVRELGAGSWDLPLVTLRSSTLATIVILPFVSTLVATLGLLLRWWSWLWCPIHNALFDFIEERRVDSLAVLLVGRFVRECWQRFYKRFHRHRPPPTWFNSLGVDQPQESCQPRPICAATSTGSTASGTCCTFDDARRACFRQRRRWPWSFCWLLVFSPSLPLFFFSGVTLSRQMLVEPCVHACKEIRIFLVVLFVGFFVL